MPGALDQVQAEIALHDGVEVSSIIDDERMMVVVRCLTEEEKKIIFKKIETVEHVRGMHSVYDCFKNLCDQNWKNPKKILTPMVMQWINAYEAG